jgi:ubiquitin-protein ligase
LESDRLQVVFVTPFTHPLVSAKGRVALDKIRIRCSSSGGGGSSTSSTGNEIQSCFSGLWVAVVMRQRAANPTAKGGRSAR